MAQNLLTQDILTRHDIEHLERDTNLVPKSGAKILVPSTYKFHGHHHAPLPQRRTNVRKTNTGGIYGTDLQKGFMKGFTEGINGRGLQNGFLGGNY